MTRPKKCPHCGQIPRDPETHEKFGCKVLKAKRDKKRGKT